MKRFLLFLYFFIPAQFNQLFSQSEMGTVYNDYRTLATRKANTTLTYSDIEGSPYYRKEFINSTVFLKDGSFANVPIRYDILMDEIEFMQDNKILWLNKKEIRNIRLGSDLIFVSAPVEDTSKLAYFFLLETGKYTLYVKKRVGYFPYVPPQGYTASLPERIIPEKDEFFLKPKGMPGSKIKSKKSLLTILSDNGAAQAFIKKEKIKYDNAEDLKKLINFLNSE